MPLTCDGRPDGLEAAVLETVLYSDLFDYPLTCEEIAYYLAGARAGGAQVRACLASSRWLNRHLAEREGWVFIRGREQVVAQRRGRRAPSARLWIRARRFARVLAALPFVRMVGVTGALAMDNSAAGDDIDVLIVTAPGRAWTARLLSVGVVIAGKLFGDTLCPNYVITEDALALEARNVFAAHEFAQMTPLVGWAVFDHMQRANSWVRDYLPNACAPMRREPEIRPGAAGRAFKRAGEWMLGGALGDRLEAWEMRRKLRKFAAKLSPASGAILDCSHVKGHFDDYTLPILRRHARRLAERGIDADRPVLGAQGAVTRIASVPGAGPPGQAFRPRPSQEPAS